MLTSLMSGGQGEEIEKLNKKVEDSELKLKEYYKAKQAVDSKNLVLEQILRDSEAKEKEISSQYHDQFCHL